MKKEKRQLRYPGLKAGSIYGTVIFFIPNYSPQI